MANSGQTRLFASPDGPMELVLPTMEQFGCRISPVVVPGIYVHMQPNWLPLKLGIQRTPFTGGCEAMFMWHNAKQGQSETVVAHKMTSHLRYRPEVVRKIHKQSIGDIATLSLTSEIHILMDDTCMHRSVYRTILTRILGLKLGWEYMAKLW